MLRENAPFSGLLSLFDEKCGETTCFMPSRGLLVYFEEKSGLKICSCFGSEVVQ